MSEGRFDYEVDDATRFVDNLKDRVHDLYDKNEELKEEIERLNNRLKTSNDTCNYLRNTIDKAIFFIQNQELHKSKDTTGAITMKERELIDILLGSDSNEQ